MSGYLLGRGCEDCGARRGDPCRSLRKGGSGEPMTGYHDSRKRPADLLLAHDARTLCLRSNDAGTCLYCGRTIQASYARWAWGEFFCSNSCAGSFGRAAAMHEFRLVEREADAAEILAERKG